MTHYFNPVLCESNSQNGDNCSQLFMIKSSPKETKLGSDDLSAGPLWTLPFPSPYGILQMVGSSREWSVAIIFYLSPPMPIHVLLSHNTPTLRELPSVGTN